MADKPIQVGDLVMVVRGHLCDRGTIYQVNRISNDARSWSCLSCGERGISFAVWVEKNYELGGERWGVPLEWLKRLDPDSIADEVLAEDGVTA